jgi:hypothetical protein
MLCYDPKMKTYTDVTEEALKREKHKSRRKKTKDEEEAAKAVCSREVSAASCVYL